MSIFFRGGRKRRRTGKKLYQHIKNVDIKIMFITLSGRIKVPTTNRKIKCIVILFILVFTHGRYNANCGR